MESLDGRDSELQRLLIALTICWCVGLIITTQQRVMVWHSDVTLWQATVATDPRLLRPRVNLGTAYMDRGDRELARFQWDQAAIVHATDVPLGIVHPQFIGLQIALTRASLAPLRSERILRQFGCVYRGSWTCPQK